MVAPFHNQVRLDGYDFQDAQFTVKLHAGIVAADAGKAVTWDSSAANQVKLAGDGDAIAGYLLRVENRDIEGQLVGLVSLQFAETLAVKAGLAGGQVVAVGSVVCGSATPGQVRAAVQGTDIAWSPRGPRVVELRDAGATAVVVAI